MHTNRITQILMIITGILLVTAGLMTVRNPASALVSVAFFLGIVITFAGITYLFGYFAEKHFIPSPGWMLVQGILDILIGVLLLSNIGVTAASLPFIVGFWAMFAGINRAVFSLDMRKAGYEKWWIVCLTGVAAILLSVLIIIFPVIGAGMIVFTITALLLWYGVMLIAEGFLVKPPR